MRQRKQTAGDMMTLGGEGIPRPVRKKGRLRLKAKQHRRLKKGLAAASAVAIVVGGTFGINALFFNKAAPNTVAEGFDTICLELPTDGSTPDLHSALENIGYMNARFQAQDVWYSEMQGSVNTMLSQQVNTWKQYSDGVLIQTDITTSSLINSAKQFCWVGDRVIWREAAGGPSTYDGIDTAWKDGAPYGNMSVEDYKTSRGLPGTAFSVYVINEETLLDASEVTANGDGTYTQTYHLDPATDKAPAYYVNQMMYTGGLTSLPTFDYITVTYTFDATWQVLSSEIEEAYTATKGVNAKCTATYSTQYEYGTDRAYSTAYDDYFKSYADKPATGAPTEQELTAADCLAEAFGTVLTQPVTFSLHLTLNGQPFEGLVYVDASDTSALSLRARIGEVFLQYAGEDVFLRYGDGVKVKLSVPELTALISSLTEGEEVQTMADKEGGISFDTDELLAQLGSGSFTVAEDKRSATLSSELSLMGLQLPVTFRFLVAEDGAVTLGDVAARLTLGNTELGATLAFSQEELPALTEQEAAGYVPLMPYVQNVLSVLSGEALRVGVSYAAEDFAVEGSFDVMTDELCVQGTIAVAYKSAKKELSFLFADGAAYLAVDGIRIKADVTEALALLGNFVELPELPELPDVSALDFGQLVSTALSPEFAALFAVSEADNALSLAVKGTELLKAFGVDFALGDVALSVEEGEISASALGAELTLTAGEAFSFTTDGYVDGVKLAQNILSLLQNDYLCADIAYAAGELAVSGTVTLDMNALAAKGTLVLNYKSATKTIGILYADGAVYVEVEGIRLTANVEELVALIGSLLGKDVTLGTPEGDLIEQVLSLNFAELISISEGETSVEILLKGTELLQAFGIDFALGDVQLSVTEGELSAAALGAELTLTAGEAFTFTTDGYVDGVKLAQNILALLQNDYLCADVAYAAGELAVSGTVTVDMNALAAKGTLVLNYKSATKTIGILYADGAVYVEVEGIKLTANVEGLVSLIGSLLGKDVTLGTPEGDLIEQVLSLNFAELVSISESETSVEILLKGTELLQAFGIDFALGDVQLSVEEGEISAAALGAELTLTAGEVFTFTTDGYVDGVKLAQNILALLQNDYLCADIAYAAGELAVSGTVTLDVNALAAKGTLVLNYKSATKTVGILYADGAVYVEVEGIRLTANVEELVALIGSLLGKDVTLGTPEGDLIEQVLSLNFAELVSISEGETSVEILLKGTELLKAFGIDFALGDVALSVTEGEISAAALGAELTLTAGEAFSFTTDGYVDGVKLAQNILALLQNDYLCADIAYAAGDLAVSGTVTLDMSRLAAKGMLVLNYKSATKTVGVLYADGAVYVEVEGIKLTANVEELVALIGSLLGKDVTLGTPEGDLLEQVLSLNFAELVSISESETSVEILLKGTELLKVFGIDFALGDVALSVAEGELSAAALGAELTLTAGEAFTFTTDGYVDGVKLAQNILALLQNDYLCADVTYAAGDLTVSGTVTLDVNTLAAKGTLVLNYKSATKTIGILYADGAVYVEVEGIKLTANVEELVSLIGSLLGKDVTLGTPEGDLIEQILSLNFAELVSISEGETSVEILLKGTELLKAFGIDFALGDVALSVAEGEISASALGAELSITAGEAFTYTTDGYVDGVKLAQNVLTLLQNDYLCADIAYAAGELAVSGTVTLDMNALAAKGTLVLNYKSATKTVGILYADGAVYVEVEGIRLTANVEELVSLIGSLLGKDVTLDTPEGDLIEQILSLNFAELVSISEGETSVEILLKGTELLKAFGIDFALGDVALSVAEGEISAAALGAELTLTAGEAFTYTTDGYVDGVALAKNVLTLLQNDYLCADIAYAAGELAVSGTVTLDVNALAAKGTLVLNYKSATKTVGVLYADGAVYVEVEGIRLTANVEELVALIGSLLGKDVTLGTPEGDLIEQILSLNFAELVSISEGETSVEILLKGTELLKAFGIDFALGDVAFSVEEGEISASALGAELTLTAGEAFTYTTDGYVELAPVFDLVKTVLTDGRIALGGSLKLKYKNMAAEVAIENGVLSWKDGFALSLDLTVIANGTRQTIKVSADASQLRLVYGSVGVALGYDELYKLSDAFEAVYERVARTIRSYVAGADIPATAEELMNTLGAGAAVTEIFASVDLPSLIDGVHFGGATGTEGSMGTVTLGGFTFDLIMQNGAFSLALAESKAGDVTFSGKVDIAASGRLPDAPAGTPEESGLMTADDLCELLDFVGAAVGTLASQDVTVSFAGSTKNADNEDVYNISGQLVYHAGASGKVVTIDVDGKSIVVDPTMYLMFRLVLEDKRTEGNDLYLDFWMFDAEGDGELDFFVSISKYPGKTYADDGETRLDQPLCFRVPAGDILTLLASGVSLTEGKLSGFLTGLGLPADAVDAVFSTLDAFFGSKWLTDTDKAQLGALGNVLMSTLGIDAKLEGILGELNSAIGGALDDAAAVDPGKYLSELGIRQDEAGVTFFLTLNSDLIYGGNGLAPLTIELTKTQAAGGESLLSGVLLGNVWGNQNTEATGISFGFAFDKTQLSASSADAQLTAADGTKLASLAFEQFQSYTFKGVDELIKAIAASATYPVADGEYALNEKFIVEGTASASLDIFGGIDLTGIGVQLAVSLKEDGSPVVNIRISYEKYSLIFIPVINSDGVTDLTIEDGMVYVRRTAGGETTYRVAPLDKFFAGFLTEHLAYLFNFSDTIADAIGSAEASGGGSSSGDYGAVLGNILSSYSYAPSGSGKAASWSLTLNGNSLTNGALTDILLTLGTDEEGILRTLNVDTSLIDLIRLSLPLTFQNPCGESYPDPTTNVKDLLSGADLASVDWNAMAENAYLAPQTSTVSYAVDGVQVGSQQVWYSGDMLLTALARPDLAAWQKEGYTLSWKDFAFTPNGVCEAVYSPNLYPVTIVAPVDLGGDWTDNGDGTYSFTTQMYYDEALTLTWGSKTHVFRVRTDNNVFDLGAAIGEDSVVWEDAVCDIVANGSTITVPLTPDTVVYTSSSVAFTLDGTSLTGQSTAEFNAQYTLLTPTAEGYTFLGWYKTEDGELTRVTELAYQGGGNVTTVSAMWVSNLSDAAITIERSGSWFSYDQRISFQTEGGKVVGEYAGHFTVSASYELTFKWNTVSYDVDTSDFAPYETTSGWQTGVATSHTPVADPTARLTFTVSVLLNGQSVGATSVYAEKK